MKMKCILCGQDKTIRGRVTCSTTALVVKRGGLDLQGVTIKQADMKQAWDDGTVTDGADRYRLCFCSNDECRGSNPDEVELRYYLSQPEPGTRTGLQAYEVTTGTFIAGKAKTDEDPEAGDLGEEAPAEEPAPVARPTPVRGPVAAAKPPVPLPRSTRVPWRR
jgi:hypothetical protein